MLPCLTFSIPKYTSTVSGSKKLSVILALLCFADKWFGHIWTVEKEKLERKQKWNFNVEIFTLFDVKMI